MNARTQRFSGSGLILFKKLSFKYGIDPDNIYNFDVTGLAMGLTATAKVITWAEYYSSQSLLLRGICEWVTTIECSSMHYF